MSAPVKDPTKGQPGYASSAVLMLKRNFFDEMSMPEQHDILSDAEREALALVSAPVVAKPLVLVVDDNAVNREALILYLKSRGLTVSGRMGPRRPGCTCTTSKESA